jgi:hypothetical protein
MGPVNRRPHGRIYGRDEQASVAGTRRGGGSVQVTTEDSRLPDFFPFLKTLDPKFAAFEFDADLMRVPKGTPINLLTNVHPKDVKSVLLA